MPRHLPLPTLDQPQTAPIDPDQAAAASSSPTAAATADTEHLESIQVDQLEAAAGEIPPPPSNGLPLGADGLLSVEAFTAGLRQALTLGGHLTGLQALLVSPSAPTYPDAAAAIYESIRAVPALHFLIRPGGLWLQRAAAIMIWAVPVGAGVRAELAERRRPAGRVPESSQTAA
jgi:hypothetical protein